MSRRLVILDRDGVINHDSDEFIKTPAEWLPIDGSIEAIAKLSSAGFTIAVATNQSGIGRKLLDTQALDSMHDKLRTLVKDAGGEVGPTHSAALLVVSDLVWPLVDLRVDWHESDPIAAVRELWTAYEPQMQDYVTRALDPTSAPSYGVPGDE